MTGLMLVMGPPLYRLPIGLHWILTENGLIFYRQ